MRASEDEIPIRDYVSVVVQLHKERISHDFAVVDKLIVPVIFGVDSLQGNGLTLDFSSTLFKVDGRMNYFCRKNDFFRQNGRKHLNS